MLDTAVHRLTDAADAMGTLFKAVAITAPERPGRVCAG